MIDYQTFCQLRQAWDEQHLTMAQIARALHLDPQTVKKWVQRPRYERRRAPRRASKLDDYKPAIARWLAQHPFTAVQIWQRLRAEGFTGGGSIVRDYVRTVRPPRAPAYLTLTYAPGQCAQIDWGAAGTIPVGGTPRALSFLVFVLCHSRWLHVEFTLGQSQEWFLGCQRRAFEALGAVPAEVMVDNCKTAVLAHRVGEVPVCNPHYLDFARHYGFTVKPCGPRQPQAKGRVENAVGYVKKNFLAGRELRDVTTLNAEARVWLETVANVRRHGETKRTPLELLAEERAALRPLPASPYEAALVRTVRVSNRCRVTVDTNRYSVPPRYASTPLTLQLASDRLRLFDGQTLVAEHVRSFDRHRDYENPDHVRTLLDERRQARHQRIFLRFLALSPRAAAYHAQLAERRLNGRHHVEKIVALAEIHGLEAVSRALDDAHELGAYSCEYIANLLEQRRRLLPEAGALHLTRASDLLELELPPPDLSPYELP
jgi:transposase/DUF971 family protein